MIRYFLYFILLGMAFLFVCIKGLRRRHLITAIIFFGITLFCAGSFLDKIRGMHKSKMPLQVNSVLYQADAPLYYSDTDQDYFISVRDLAEGLGIHYKKKVGLFYEEYILGSGSFSVSCIAPGKKFYRKGGRLFIGLSYLNSKGLFQEIHVHNSPTLANGNDRTCIYIDNYPQRFQYAWTEHEYVSHAFGGINGEAYTNSLEAFEENYKKGHRVFEVDLRLTADDGLVAAHDLPLNNNGKPMTAKEFKKYKVLGRYTSLSFRDIVYLMKKYPDFYLVTDTKEIKSPYVEKQFQYMVSTAQKIDSTVLARIIPQIYNEEMFYKIMDIYNWNSMIYTLYALDSFSEKEVAEFAYREGIQVITANKKRATKKLLKELFGRDILVYMHTYNDPTDVAKEQGGVKSFGVHGVYTDFLVPKSPVDKQEGKYRE